MNSDAMDSRVSEDGDDENSDRPDAGMKCLKERIHTLRTRVEKRYTARAR